MYNWDSESYLPTKSIKTCVHLTQKGFFCLFICWHRSFIDKQQIWRTEKKYLDNSLLSREAENKNTSGSSVQVEIALSSDEHFNVSFLVAE